MSEKLEYERDEYLRVIALNAEHAKTFVGDELLRNYGEPVDLGPPDFTHPRSTKQRRRSKSSGQTSLL
jgi:hypothetical protein